MAHTLIAISPEELESIIARAVRRAIRETSDDGMISQTGSPLGSRRHCNAVKRRIESASSGAAKVGRRYLLTPEALAEELANVSAASAHRPEREAEAGAGLRRKLGLQ